MPATQPLPEELIQRLIEEITPLNNTYRQAVREGQPFYISTGYLWDIGDILERSGVEKITPVASAIHERSYITRELMTYSFRIRRYFADRGTIKRRFGKVKSYAAFRVAFPLLENKRYRLSRAKERELVRLLNSGKEYREIKREIASFKQARVPDRKKRDMHTHELDPFAQAFDERYAELRFLMEQGSRPQMMRFSREMGPDVLLFCNKLCLSLADENFTPPGGMPALDGINRQWRELFVEMYSVTCAERATRNRARRRINPMRFVAMGNYMDILRDARKTQEHIENR